MTAAGLSGRIALVTGAASGIGRATALRLTAEGMTVACLDLDGDGAAATAADCGGDAAAWAVDITDPNALDNAVAGVEKQAGPVHAVVANAGIPGEGSAHELEPEFWNRVIAVNLTGQFNTVRAVLRGGMLDRGAGSIVLMASVVGMSGVPGLAAYSAAKGGVIALTRQLGVEYSRHGIRVNCVCPGTVETPLLHQALEARGGDVAEQIAARARQYPMQRLGQSEDVADLVTFLAGDQSSWMTGQAVAVDGGITSSLFPLS